MGVKLDRWMELSHIRYYILRCRVCAVLYKCAYADDFYLTSTERVKARQLNVLNYFYWKYFFALNVQNKMLWRRSSHVCNLI